MATTLYRRGYGWSLPTGSGPSPKLGSENNNVRVYSAKGLSAPGVLGSTPLPQIGTPIPGTIFVYVRPRLTQDEGIGGGGGGSQFPYVPFEWPGGFRAGGAGGRIPVAPRDAIHITNPAYAFYRRYQRSPSIGMAGAGSMGRVMDVPFQSNAPWFSGR